MAEHEKADEVIESIRDVIKDCFLFAHLDEATFRKLALAMFKVRIPGTCPTQPGLQRRPRCRTRHLHAAQGVWVPWIGHCRARRAVQRQLRRFWCRPFHASSTDMRRSRRWTTLLVRQ